MFKMHQKPWIFFFTLFLAFLFIGSALAIEPGNKRKGKYTYRKVYKACFERGVVESPKPSINPDAHTQAEWTDIFTQKDFDAFGCADEWAALPEEDVRDIYAYLHGHASDSPTPAKCK